MSKHIVSLTTDGKFLLTLTTNKFSLSKITLDRELLCNKYEISISVVSQDYSDIIKFTRTPTANGELIDVYLMSVFSDKILVPSEISASIEQNDELNMINSVSFLNVQDISDGYLLRLIMELVRTFIKNNDISVMIDSVSLKYV